MRTRIRWLGPALAALVAALSCDRVPNDALQSCEASQVTPGAVSTDILFVIDNSSSMYEEQTALQNSLAQFITLLSSSPVANDFQIGVTTTEVGSCTASCLAGSFTAQGTMRGDSPTLVPDFQAAVGVGTTGSNWEQPFEAMKLAIEKSAPGGPNAGFIRPGARLAIFFLSDEDDCSTATDPGSSLACEQAKLNGGLYPVSGYADFLRAPIQGEVKDVVVYAVAGFSAKTLAPSCGRSQCTDQTCSTAFDKGDRFLALAQQFGTAGRIGSICDPAFDGALAEFADVIMSQRMPLDGAPADPGLLVVSVTTVTGDVVSCGSVATAGTAGAGTANVIYTAPEGGLPASLWFQNACALNPGDRVNVDVVCAG